LGGTSRLPKKAKGTQGNGRNVSEREEELDSRGGVFEFRESLGQGETDRRKRRKGGGGG